MSLVDFPRSPYLDAYAFLGHCCSYAAYCPFYMFKGLDARGCGVVVVGSGRGEGGESERGKLVWVFAIRMRHIAIFICLNVLVWRGWGVVGRGGEESDAKTALKIYDKNIPHFFLFKVSAYFFITKSPLVFEMSIFLHHMLILA